MTALAAGTQRPSISDPSFNSAPQKGSTIIYQGALIMLDTSGYARPAAASVSGAFCAGVYVPPFDDLDRSDTLTVVLADGAKTVSFMEGTFGFLNDTGNPVLATTQPGTVLYAVDDQTVSLDSGSSTRPVAGRLVRLDATCVGGPVVMEVSIELGALLNTLITVTDAAAAHLAGAETFTGSKAFGAAGSNAADPTFGKEADHTVKVTDTTTAATAGGALAIKAGKSGTSGTGGVASIVGGAGDTTGAGGIASLTGGAGGSSSGTGGAANVKGGAGSAGNANGGAVNLDGGAKNGSGVDGLIGIGLNNGSFVKFGKKIQATASAFAVTDPGTGQAIPVTASGSVAITQNGAETNTVADPTFIGQTMSFFVDTDTSGARVITFASRINQAANTIATLTEVGDFLKVEAITIAGALKWQVVANDGAVLS